MYYTDPGTGALIWQLLSAGVIGIMFYFNRVMSWWRSLKEKVFKH